MSENTCKTCEFWKDTDGDYPKGSIELGKCKRVKMFWDCTEWEDIPDHWECRRVLTEEAKDELAFVQDGSDYSAELITRPDFGCVQWKELTHPLPKDNEI